MRALRLFQVLFHVLEAHLLQFQLVLKYFKSEYGDDPKRNGRALIEPVFDRAFASAQTSA